MWLCTNWQIDWTAISTVTAGGAGLLALTGYALRRNARVRLLTRLIAADLVFIQEHLKRKESKVGVGYDEENQALADVLVVQEQHVRDEIIAIPKEIPALPVLREHVSELDALPVALSDSLTVVLLRLSLLETSAAELSALGPGSQDGAYDLMPSFRTSVIELQQSVGKALMHSEGILKSRWRLFFARLPF